MAKTKEISPEKINKFFNYLIALKQHFAKHNTIDSNQNQELHKRFSLPFSVMKRVVDCGFMAEIIIPGQKKSYKFILETIEPIHARKLIVCYRNYHNNLQKEHREKSLKTPKKRKLTKNKGLTAPEPIYKPEQPTVTHTVEVKRTNESMLVNGTKTFGIPVKSTKPQRVVSLFWGLIYFTY